MTTLQQHLGRRLAAARQLRGLTLAQAAHEAFLDADRLALIESGPAGAIAGPTFDEMRLLCLVYRVAMEDLVGGYEPVSHARPRVDRPEEGTGGGRVDDNEGGGSGTVQALRTNGHLRAPTNGNARITLPPRAFDPRPPRSYLRIAAMVLGCLVLIGAVGVGTAVLWPNPPREATKTLPYRDAILILVDAKETEKRRELSAFRVFTSVVGGIRALKAVAREQGPIGKQARRNLTQLRDIMHGKQVLTRPEEGNVYLIESPPLVLARQLKGGKEPPSERRHNRNRLTKAVELGILALKKVETEQGLPLKLRTHFASYIRKLRKELP